MSAAITAIALAGCAAAPDAAPGISKREMQMLQLTYWKPGFGVPKHDKASLESLMDKSTDAELDGEYAEAHWTRLRVALAASGDDLFASVLATRNPEVQRAVRKFLAQPVTSIKPRYPKTEALLANINGRTSSFSQSFPSQ